MEICSSYVCSGVGHLEGPIEGNERPYDHLAAYQKPGQDHECNLSNKGIFWWLCLNLPISYGEAY